LLVYKCTNWKTTTIIKKKNLYCVRAAYL
jgi:hypothetical protein